MSASYLPAGLPIPVPEIDGLSTQYWEGLRKNEIWVQRCKDCRTWQWGPEWMCHACNSFETGWEKIEGTGRIYSWERPWHPVHPALKGHGPYLVVLVEFPQYGDIRMIGNLLGDPHQTVTIGAEVSPVFEHHEDATPPFTLLQWQADG